MTTTVETTAEEGPHHCLSVAETYALWCANRFSPAPEDDDTNDLRAERIVALAHATLEARPITSAADLARMISVVEIELGEAPHFVEKLKIAIDELLAEERARSET